MKSAAPFPPPPDVEPFDDVADRHAPVTFTARGIGSVLISLDGWEIGELQSDNPAHGYQFRILLPGLRPGWRCRPPLPYAEACDRAVAIVRQWLEAAPSISAWIIAQARERAGDRQRKGRQ